MVSGKVSDGNWCRLVWGMGNRPRTEAELESALKEFGLLHWSWRLKQCVVEPIMDYS